MHLNIAFVEGKQSVEFSPRFEFLKKKKKHTKQQKTISHRLLLGINWLSPPFLVVKNSLLFVLSVKFIEPSQNQSAKTAAPWGSLSRAVLKIFFLMTQNLVCRQNTHNF